MVGATKRQTTLKASDDSVSDKPPAGLELALCVPKKRYRASAESFIPLRPR